MKHKNSIAVHYMRKGKMLETDVDLEDALDRAGAGKYQLFHCLVACVATATALQELLGYAFVLPAATCDLQIPSTIKGLLISIPPIGIILTAALWGRAADRLGRKPVLIGTLIAAGAFGLVAAFMPNLVSFALLKLCAAMFMSCPTSLSYAYIAEMLPKSRRDFVVLIFNGFLQISTVMSPLIAWAILSFEWQYELGAILFRPWRLLTAVYAFTMVLSGLWLTQIQESPKWLLAKGRTQETLDVLTYIYVKNSGKPPDNFGIKSLKPHNSNEMEFEKEGDGTYSVWTLCRPPYCKWFFFLGFLMFGVFSLLNGLYLFATDTINQVLRDTSNEEGTLCVLIDQTNINETSTVCQDHISQDTFIIMAVTTFIYGLVIALASFAPVSKKTLLVLMYLVTGTVTLLAGLLRNRIVAGVAMSAGQLTGLGIGPITAYAVQLFPTQLRGTAVGGVHMFGRVGATLGATSAGYLLAVNCTATFYGFAILIFVCAALSFLLPNTQSSSKSDGN